MIVKCVICGTVNSEAIVQRCFVICSEDQFELGRHEEACRWFMGAVLKGETPVVYSQHGFGSTRFEEFKHDEKRWWHAPMIGVINKEVTLSADFGTKFEESRYGFCVWPTVSHPYEG